MFYTLNLSLHSFHTVKAGSNLEQKIIANNSKSVMVNGQIHKVFKTTKAATAALAMLFCTARKHKGQKP